MNDILLQSEFPDYLKAAVERIGGVPELARRCGLDRSNLYKMIKGKLQPQPALLAALGIEEVRAYILPEGWAKWYESRKSDAQSIEVGQITPAPMGK